MNFLDLCAGIGGFRLGVEIMNKEEMEIWTREVLEDRSLYRWLHLVAKNEEADSVAVQIWCGDLVRDEVIPMDLMRIKPSPKMNVPMELREGMIDLLEAAVIQDKKSPADQSFSESAVNWVGMAFKLVLLYFGYNHEEADGDIRVMANMADSKAKHKENKHEIS